MNTKLKLAFIRRYSEQGFAMPIVIGLGLIMLLIGATMIVRSRDDQVAASIQKSTAKSFTVAEGGVTRAISILNQPNNAFLLKLNYDPINPATTEPSSSPLRTYLGSNGILDDGDGETTAVDQWSNSPSSIPCSSSISTPSGLKDITNIGSGSYQVKAYRYQDPDGISNTGDEKGTLLVEGKQESAESQVQVSMPIIQRSQAGSFAGLYASKIISLGNNDIKKAAGGNGSAANVICKDCTVPVDKCTASGPTQEGLNSAVGRGNNSEVDGKIFIADPQLPPVPTAPLNACSATSGPNCSIDLGSFNVGILPRPEDIANRVTWHTADPIKWPLSTISAPYHYKITDMPIGNNVVTVDTTTPPAPALVPLPDAAPVYLYVSGNVTMNGTGGIAHSGSPERLRLYGKPADANDANDQSITISGGASASRIFIYAPDATVGINGGSNDPDIFGAVWAKTWNGSNSNNADIQVPDDMPTLLGGSFGNVGVQTYGSSTPNSWQRQPVAN